MFFGSRFDDKVDYVFFSLQGQTNSTATFPSLFLDGGLAGAGRTAKFNLPCDIPLSSLYGYRLPEFLRHFEGY
jgi:hypothetical protein